MRVDAKTNDATDAVTIAADFMYEGGVATRIVQANTDLHNSVAIIVPGRIEEQVKEVITLILNP